MTKKEIYEDALVVKTLKAPTKIKIRMLSELCGIYEDHWKVIGITKDALKVFFENNFERKSKMGINRSHFQDRYKTFTHLLTHDLNCDEWWEYYDKHNVTVLATSTENMTNIWSEVYDVDTNLNLFKSSGFSWKHGKQEQQFLKETYESMTNG